MRSAKHDAYCKYDNHLLTTFTSSMFLAGMLSSIVASPVTRRVGRQATMLVGGAMFLAGSAIGAGAIHIAMLIVGRMLLGFGMEFTAQPPHFIFLRHHLQGGVTHSQQPTTSSLSLAQWPRALSTISQTGSLTRVGVCPFGLAAVPATIILVGALFVQDTPSNLLLRGKLDKARASLQHIRGLDANVEAEFNDISCAVEDAQKNAEHAYARLNKKG
ncbi:hypothetical protein ACP4OV_024307 [Aristida adscensionis]